ncbi:MAG: isoprenyl transferase [Candidatus Pacebacteria bacterium]|nr:isoprenyl transferase [Candidatus Paceibacterota bacterium]
MTVRDAQPEGAGKRAHEGTSDNLRIPRHVGIIMDGNGRWAHQRNLPRIEGHRAGAESVRRVVEACSELNVKYLTLYAFSTENWRRSKAEISQLMGLLRHFLQERVEDLEKYRIRLHAVGQLDRLPSRVRGALKRVMERTRDNDQGVLTLALSYGSRNEIVTAAKRIAADAVAGRLAPDDITQELFSSYLFTSGLPDPDLIIRTSAEQRLSNFLLWQASYSEFWFTPTLWPDFSKAEFKRAVLDYSERKRRYGGVTDDHV